MIKISYQLESSYGSRNFIMIYIHSTGAIAKSFDGNKLDLILAHYEVRADDDVRIIIDKSEECLQNGLALASIPSSEYPS